jgi:hypothetical protein
MINEKCDSNKKICNTIRRFTYVAVKRQHVISRKKTDQERARKI